jgi:nitrite reductase/ring-hydroxylating ferredoxin subunit
VAEEPLRITENGEDAVYHFLATKAELQKTGQISRWLDGHDILLYEYENEIKALSNICRHFGGPVGYYKARRGVFTCLWHNWQYSAKDGSCLTYPGYPLRKYALKIVEDRIYINLLG